MRVLASLLLFTAITGCATTTTNWDGGVLRIDATSMPRFQTSVAAFRQKLRPEPRLRFEIALHEIWLVTQAKAGADSSVDEITQQYFAQINGLEYDQIITLAGPAAEQTFHARVARERTAGVAGPSWGSSDTTVGTNNSGVYTGQTPAWSAY